MKLKLKPKFWLPAITLLLCGLAVYLSVNTVQPKTTAGLQQSDLAQMIKPGVVRIINHATGQVLLPSFEINTDQNNLSFPENRPGQAEKLDLYLSGSGFVINPDGYILTNAHVATEESIKENYLEEVLGGALQAKLGSLDDQTLLEFFHTPDNFANFYQNALAALRSRAQFNLASKLVVLNPSDSQEYLTSLLKTGLEAQIVSANDNFAQDEKDIALIKIQAGKLPALTLGNSARVAVGDKIFVFGFPSTAEINGRSPLEATLTQGLVSALKFSQSKEFKIFQTDAKISQGSSGGPLFDQAGRVIGIITFQTGDALRQKGDNFAFAIPINLAKETLARNHITNEEGAYAELFRQAITAYQDKHCEAALEKFNAASQLNPNFTSPKIFEGYTGNCEALMADGGSLDNPFRQFWENLKQVSSFTWFVVLGRLLLILLAMLALEQLYTRLKKDERQIEALELELQAEEDRKNELLKKMEASGTPLPLPEPELHAHSRLALDLPHPHLLDFITEGRKVELSDEQLHEELLKAGWSESEIQQAFKHS